MMTTMPFGCHKRTLLTELDQHYLSWLMDLPDLRDPLREAVEAEMDRRIGAPEVSQ